MLESLRVQSILPDQVVVVAAGSEESRAVVNQFPSLNSQYIHVSRAGISRQRNAGIRALDTASTLVGYLDDDIVLQPDAIEAMLAFWETAPSDVGGAGFNFRNVLAPETARKWSLRPAQFLYRLFLGRDSQKGRVLRSGFPTPIYPVDETIQVEWLEPLAVVFRKQVFDRFQWDERYEGYDYVGFVDFTYTVSKEFRLCVVSDAWVTHYPGSIRNSYVLGIMQVVNRVYFVRKHPELSLPRCLVTLGLHAVWNVAVGLMLRDTGYLKRAWGNCVGFGLVVGGGMGAVSGGIK
jgi:glycosyltransferase involved in cell wall biosynthesis